jgi:hypothetical protein
LASKWRRTGHSAAGAAAAAATDRLTEAWSVWEPCADDESSGAVGHSCRLPDSKGASPRLAAAPVGREAGHAPVGSVTRKTVNLPSVGGKGPLFRSIDGIVSSFDPSLGWVVTWVGSEPEVFMTRDELADVLQDADSGSDELAVVTGRFAAAQATAKRPAKSGSAAAQAAPPRQRTVAPASAAAAALAAAITPFVSGLGGEGSGQAISQAQVPAAAPGPADAATAATGGDGSVAGHKRRFGAEVSGSESAAAPAATGGARTSEAAGGAATAGVEVAPAAAIPPAPVRLQAAVAEERDEGTDYGGGEDGGDDCTASATQVRYGDGRFGPKLGAKGKRQRTSSAKRKGPLDLETRKY